MLPKQSKGNERTKMVVVRECLSNQENMSNENASTRWFTKLIIGTEDPRLSSNMFTRRKTDTTEHHKCFCHFNKSKKSTLTSAKKKQTF
jgi:hypothetical protein